MRGSYQKIQGRKQTDREEGKQVISQVELKMEVKRVAHLEGTTEIEEENIRATGHIPTTEFWTQFFSSAP